MVDGLFGLLTLQGQTYVTSSRVVAAAAAELCHDTRTKSHDFVCYNTGPQLHARALPFLFIYFFLPSFLFFRVWGEDFSLLTFYFFVFFLFLFFSPLSLVPRKPHFPCERLRLRTVPRFRPLPSRSVMLHAPTSPFQRRIATRPSGFTSLSRRERSKAGTSRRREKKTHIDFCPLALRFFPSAFYQRAAVEAAPPCGLNSASVEPPIRQMTFLPLTAGGYYLNY